MGGHVARWRRRWERSFWLAGESRERFPAPRPRSRRGRARMLHARLQPAGWPLPRQRSVEELPREARAILSPGGLGPALHTLARRAAIVVELDVAAIGRLPEPAEVAAYYIVSEALTNATRHTHTSRAPPRAAHPPPAPPPAPRTRRRRRRRPSAPPLPAGPTTGSGAPRGTLPAHPPPPRHATPSPIRFWPAPDHRTPTLASSLCPTDGPSRCAASWRWSTRPAPGYRQPYETAQGSGLVGLKDRLEGLGGTFTIDSPAGAAPPCMPSSRSATD